MLIDTQSGRSDKPTRNSIHMPFERLPSTLRPSEFSRPTPYHHAEYHQQPSYLHPSKLKLWFQRSDGGDEMAPFEQVRAWARYPTSDQVEGFYLPPTEDRPDYKYSTLIIRSTPSTTSALDEMQKYRIENVRLTLTPKIQASTASAPTLCGTPVGNSQLSAPSTSEETSRSESSKKDGADESDKSSTAEEKTRLSPLSTTETLSH